MIKQSLYPKTKRVSYEDKILITEKFDGSNLGFFNLNGKLLIVQRNYTYFLEELLNGEVEAYYKGLKGWLTEHGEDLLNSIYPNSGVFGEWIGMGKIRYNGYEGKYIVFAKARINEEYQIHNIIYNPELFNYAFLEQNVPKYVNAVDVVYKLDHYPSADELDDMYEEYCQLKDRLVEGFIVNNRDEITKYVRFKDGVKSEHTPKRRD